MSVLLLRLFLSPPHLTLRLGTRRVGSGCFERPWPTGAFWETSWRRCRSTLPLLARYESDAHTQCTSASVASVRLPPRRLDGGQQGTNINLAHSTFMYLSQIILFILFCAHQSCQLQKTQQCTYKRLPDYYQCDLQLKNHSFKTMVRIHRE